jgi:hypothetical protein
MLWDALAALCRFGATRRCWYSRRDLIDRRGRSSARDGPGTSRRNLPICLGKSRHAHYIGGMTYTTLSLRKYPLAVTDEELASYATRSERIRNLDHLASSCPSHRLGEWAASKNLPVFFVDNCWVRVPVLATHLSQFVDDMLDPTTFAHLDAELEGTDGTIVLEAEEF